MIRISYKTTFLDSVSPLLFEMTQCSLKYREWQDVQQMYGTKPSLPWVPPETINHAERMFCGSMTGNDSGMACSVRLIIVLKNINIKGTELKLQHQTVWRLFETWE